MLINTPAMNTTAITDSTQQKKCVTFKKLDKVEEKERQERQLERDEAKRKRKLEETHASQDLSGLVYTVFLDPTKAATVVRMAKDHKFFSINLGGFFDIARRLSPVIVDRASVHEMLASLRKANLPCAIFANNLRASGFLEAIGEWGEFQVLLPTSVEDGVLLRDETTKDEETDGGSRKQRKTY